MEKIKKIYQSSKSGNEINGRKRHGKKITHDSYLIVKKFNLNLNEGIKGRQFSKDPLQALLDDNIRNCGIREINHFNQFKRKEVPRLHGFRKFFTKQLVDSKSILKKKNCRHSSIDLLREYEKLTAV